MVKAVTKGLMQILKTRTDRQGRIWCAVNPHQQIENNPLKFSVTVEEALENLFIKEGSSYMRGAETYVDGLEDFRIHEIARWLLFEWRLTKCRHASTRRH